VGLAWGRLRQVARGSLEGRATDYWVIVSGYLVGALALGVLSFVGLILKGKSQEPVAQVAMAVAGFVAWYFLPFLAVVVFSSPRAVVGVGTSRSTVYGTRAMGLGVLGFAAATHCSAWFPGYGPGSSTSAVALLVWPVYALLSMPFLYCLGWSLGWAVGKGAGSG